MTPSDYSQRILLAVTGLYPQVVTESLYALAVAAAPPFVPTELHIVTSALGAERARRALLAEQPGWFQRLRRDYHLPPIAFGPESIHILHDAAGPLDDIRTPEDNQAAADFITEQVRHLTARRNSALHVSMAGGRKTMGYYLGYALSLFGRPQDRLSHVLVAADYESHPDFYYPTPYRHPIRGPVAAHPGLDARDAQVTLAEIPFVSLRHGLPEELLEGRSSFGQTVAAARRALGPPDLRISQTAHRLVAAGQPIPLPPLLLAFYSWFARRQIHGFPPQACPSDGSPESAYAAGFLEEYRRITGPLGHRDRTVARLAHGMDKAFFLETKTKLHQHLAPALGPDSPYHIRGQGRRPKLYALGLPARAIRFEQGGDGD